MNILKDDNLINNIDQKQEFKNQLNKQTTNKNVKFNIDVPTNNQNIKRTKTFKEKASAIFNKTAKKFKRSSKNEDQSININKEHTTIEPIKTTDKSKQIIKHNRRRSSMETTFSAHLRDFMHPRLKLFLYIIRGLCLL